MQQNSLPVDTPEFIRAKQVAINASDVSFVESAKNLDLINGICKTLSKLLILIKLSILKT